MCGVQGPTGRSCVDMCVLSQEPGIPCSQEAGRVGEQARLGPASLSSPHPTSPGQGPPQLRTASVALGMVQKAVPRAPSRCTKGHIDWFVEAFPGVLYISLPRHP